MATVRVIRFEQLGGPEVLTLRQEPRAEPGEGQVRLAIEAVGVSQADALFRQGRYLEAPELPARLGAEAAGVVEAVGPGVTALRPGDRAVTLPGFSVSRHGVYAESAVLPASALTGYPEGLSATQVVASWVPYLTAYGALVEYGQAARGDAVVLTAAASSVGLAALQLVRAAGARAIVTTRDPSKSRALLDAGADEVIVTQGEGVAARVREATGGAGARLLFDAVSGPMLGELVEAAAQGGTIFEYGALAGASAPPLPVWPLMVKEVNVRGYSVYEVFKHPGRLERAKRALFAGLASGAFRPTVARAFPLEQAAEAHRLLASGQHVGKIVLET
ncbi:MAG TPA: zinc-dependent alcohol dehydrogenase family protein [Polyangiaceae bacterium]|nr:zinc-dependent alcohol dehydrogenase family protein [Polyangiaceae bacterium]